MSCQGEPAVKSSGARSPSDKSSGSESQTEKHINTKSAYENAFVDPRVDEIYKSAIPDVLKNHVLWHVNHDGNCWISVGLSIMLYEMTSNGPEYFNETLAKIKTTAKNSGIEKSEEIKGFLEVLELLQINRTFKNALRILNQEQTYLKLNTGLREFAARNMTIAGKKAKDIATVKSSYGWGNVSDNLGGLFKEWAIKFFHMEIRKDRQGLSFNFLVPSIYSERVGWTYILPADAGKFKDMVTKALRKNDPNVISFVPTPAYADVLVKKSFSDGFNRQ